MSAVTILTPASQLRSGASSAVDVGAFSTLRLDLTMRANIGLDPFVDVRIETSATPSGPWREIHARLCAGGGANGWPASGSDRVSLGGFDRYVRVRWSAGRQGENPTVLRGPAGAILEPQPVLADIALFLGLAGDGKPDA